MKVCIKCKQFRMVDQYGVCGRCVNDVPNSLYFDRIGRSLVPVRSNGTVLPREEWGRVSREIERFYDTTSDSFIEEYNKKLRDDAPHLYKPLFGYVYLLHSDNGYYKIGRAKNVEHRLYQILREYPVRIELVHVIPCDDCKLIERAFHVLYADRRVQGEWFDLPDSVVERIMATTYENVKDWLK